METLDSVIKKIRASERTLFILCGLPYSGKTYITEKLIAKTEISIVRIDDLFHEGGFSWDKNILPNKAEWDVIFEDSYQVTKNILGRSENVLYDSTNHTLASREKLRELAKQSGAETTVIFVNTPKNIIWERWEKNKESTARSVVAKDLVEMTIDVFEPPTQDEHVVMISGVQ